MKCVDALAALAIMLVFAPILSGQYLRADATCRKSLGMLRQIAETKERINGIDESLRKGEAAGMPTDFRMDKITARGGESRDAIFFSFEGRELHWILWR